jgi:5-methylcytosine-specific restriction enzyme subunit McrC
VRRLVLHEYRTEHGVELTLAQRESIRALHPGLAIQPSPFATDRYDITPDHRVGLIATLDLVLEIRPKIPMSSVLFLLAYACDAADWFEDQPEFGVDATLNDLVAIMLARLVERTTRRGLLNGYQSEDEALQSPRGQILFQEQIRRRLGVAPPMEVRHDIFTPDIIENRLLGAAVRSLARLPLESALAKRELARAQGLFGGVTRMRYPRTDVPEVLFTRLNRHYQPAVALSQLILRAASLDLGTGGARGSALLIDMNDVFERFVRKALRAELGLDASTFPDQPPPMRLDEAGRIRLKPDLCIVRNGSVLWVGDAKYKRLPSGAYVNADVYQLLAYCVAFRLAEGQLIYAADKGMGSAEHVIVHGRQRITVTALDLAGAPSSILREVRLLARSVRERPSPVTLTPSAVAPARVLLP